MYSSEVYHPKGGRGRAVWQTKQSQAQHTEPGRCLALPQLFPFGTNSFNSHWLSLTLARAMSQLPVVTFFGFFSTAVNGLVASPQFLCFSRGPEIDSQIKRERDMYIHLLLPLLVPLFSYQPCSGRTARLSACLPVLFLFLFLRPMMLGPSLTFFKSIYIYTHMKQ